MFVEAGAGRPEHDSDDLVQLSWPRRSPLASGFLIDRTFGSTASARHSPRRVRPDRRRRPPDPEPGRPFEDTVPRRTGVRLAGVQAIKLLLLWRRTPPRAAGGAGAPVHRAGRRRGVLSVLEPVVRPLRRGRLGRGPGAILEVPRAVPLRPSLYKAQVPRRGRGTPDELRRVGGPRRGDHRPWVVLSHGVDRDDFLGAVRAACQGGASGFLAGRALWSDVVGRTDLGRALTEVAVPRLERLVEVVDREATPWRRA